MFTLGIDAFSSRPERSGVEWYTHHLLRAMAPQTPPDWRVVLYSLDTLSNLKPLRQRRIRLGRKTSNLWHSKQLRWPLRRGWGQLRLSWEMLRRPPNVLFVPGAMLPLMHPHRPWRRQWTVTTIHDVEFLSHLEFYRPSDRRRQEIALEFALRHAARIFVPSESVRAALADLARPDQLVMTRLGVDHTRYNVSTDQDEIVRVRKKHQLLPNFFLYVGRIDKKKNLKFLIRAYAQFLADNPDLNNWADRTKNCGLVLAGAKGFGAEEMEREIKKFGIQRAVRLLGYVPEEDLPALFWSARAFVFPSFCEGFGLPVLEALACGVPTLAADTFVLHEVAGEAAIYADPNNAEAWAAAMRRLAQDEQWRSRLHEAGIAQAKKFSWEQTADATWQALVELSE